MQFNKINNTTSESERRDPEKEDSKTIQYALNFTKNFDDSDHKLTFDFQYEDSNEDETIKKLENELYNEINKLGVGPMGVGGETTCLAVKINYFPMHIASLPVAINIQCHSSRHTEVII